MDHLDDTCPACGSPYPADHPSWCPVRYPQDPLGPARGIAFGALLGLGFFATVAALVVAFVR